jgi:sirohydrochlorin cobaltochelatase
MSDTRSRHSAVVLFAHGAREPEWTLPFERLRERLRAAGLRVELAYLGSTPPSLEQAVDELAAEGRELVTIVPMFLAQGGHLKTDLPMLVERIRARHPATELRVAAPLGEAPEVLDAMTAWIERAAQSAGQKKR